MKIVRLNLSVLFLAFGFVALPSNAEITMNATADDALPAAIVGEAPEVTAPPAKPGGFRRM